MSTKKNIRQKKFRIWRKKIKIFWKRYEKKIILFLGMFLTATISFQLGILQGQKWQQNPLVIEKISDKYIVEVKNILGKSSESNPKKESTKTNSNKSLEQDKECMLIGSKNSNKYHKLDCQWSSRIKAENRVCFKSVEDAKSKGYIPASCMK